MVNVEAMREKTFNIRFSEEEWERLDRLSAAHGINAASLIRMLLKQADTASTGALGKIDAAQHVLEKHDRALGKVKQALIRDQHIKPSKR